MLTRREKLLVRPWQQRRFNNHQRKVNCALPAIDTTTPPRRNHVSCKLKKLQREDERSARIEQDNFRLLQRMGTIMKTKRLDNEWLSTPPNFLSRIGIYYQPRHESSTTLKSSTFLEPGSEVGLSRKQRCSACNPARREKLNHQIIPEERVPWETPHPGAPRTMSQPLHAAQRGRAASKLTSVTKLPSPKSGHHGCFLQSRPSTGAQRRNRNEELNNFLEYNFNNSYQVAHDFVTRFD